MINEIEIVISLPFISQQCKSRRTKLFRPPKVPFLPLLQRKVSYQLVESGGSPLQKIQ